MSLEALNSTSQIIQPHWVLVSSLVVWGVRLDSGFVEAALVSNETQQLQVPALTSSSPDIQPKQESKAGERGVLKEMVRALWGCWRCPLEWSHTLKRWLFSLLKLQYTLLSLGNSSFREVIISASLLLSHWVQNNLYSRSRRELMTGLNPEPVPINSYGYANLKTRTYMDTHTHMHKCTHTCT